MDPVQVRNCVKILVKMHKKGLLPDHDFYLAEVQGPAAAFYDGDFSAHVIAGAISALGGKRLSGRRWCHRTTSAGAERMAAKLRQTNQQALTGVLPAS